MVDNSPLFVALLNNSVRSSAISPTEIFWIVFVESKNNARKPHRQSNEA